MSEPQTVWSGRYIAAVVDGRWEYVVRTRSIGAAVILAVHDGHVLLVEQYRVPLGAPCLELPAGLVGDETAGEPIETAALRELEEETGYSAERVDVIGTFASSPGMVGETFTLVRATGLSRIADGGGTGEENITVHRVALAEIAGFIAARRAAGVMIDVKLLLLLGAGLVAPRDSSPRRPERSGRPRNYPRRS
jgi:ADP-ribose pyrophosphatase